MRKIAVLGATGSVGMQALEIAREFKEKIEIVCLTANSDAAGLAKAANEFRPAMVALTGENAAEEELERLLCYRPRILHGREALAEACVSSGADMVVLAVLGIAGLPAFAACLENHIAVALANKESLVCGADVTRKMMDETGTQVLPVDSEHSAIFQCLGNRYDITDVAKIWITASGGPFLRLSKEEIDNAPPERALKHPNWDMGRKITVDSASLANKGLEVIEAHFMYRAPVEMIQVVVQPQSLIHSMVELKDSSVMAQLAPVDMRLPLQKAMLFPEMCKFTVNKPLNFWEIGKIEFIQPDLDRFPCLRLAYEAIETNTTAVFNTADEVAVDLYLKGLIRFGQIPELIGWAMRRFADVRAKNIGEILELDLAVRRAASKRYGEG